MKNNAINNSAESLTTDTFVNTGTTVTAGTGLTVTTGNADVLTGNVNVGTAAPANPYDISIERSVAGLIGESIQNTNGGAAAGVNLQLIVEPATADAFVGYFINGGGSFTTGIDNSDSDSFKITTGATPSAGTEVFRTDGTAIALGATATAHTITIGNTTGATSVAVTSGTGSITLTSTGTGDIILNSDDTMLLDADGVLELNSSGGAINIGNDADAQPIEIGTGAAGRLISIGNNTPATGIIMVASTGGISLTSNSTGDIVLDSDDTLLIDADGVLELNSSAGAISIGNDADAQAINIGTGGAARTITIGNTTGATAINIDTGTGDFTLDSATGNIITALDTGEVTMALQPAFLATLTNTTADVTGDGTSYTVIYDTEIYDQSADFTLATSIFTAPITGRYHFAVGTYFDQIGTSHNDGRANIQTSNRVYFLYRMNVTAVDVSGLFSNGNNAYADMDAADTASVVVVVSGSTKTVDMLGDAGATNFFSGCLVV